MKNKQLLLLLLGAGAVYFLYQRTAKAHEMSSAEQQAYLARLRQAATRQQQIEALRNQAAHTAVITDSGNIAPPLRNVGPVTSFDSPMTGGMMPSPKPGRSPIMVP